MLRRTIGTRREPVYEIAVGERTVRMSAREFCQLACEVETMFRDAREQLIEDVVLESAEDDPTREAVAVRRGGVGRHQGEGAWAPSLPSTLPPTRHRVRESELPFVVVRN